MWVLIRNTPMICTVGIPRDFWCYLNILGDSLIISLMLCVISKHANKLKRQDLKIPILTSKVAFFSSHVLRFAINKMHLIIWIFVVHAVMPIQKGKTSLQKICF